MCRTIHQTWHKNTHTLTAVFFNNSPAFTNYKICLLHMLQNFVQAWGITALQSVSSGLGPSMAVNISHRCLVRSQPLSGTGRFLAGLFTFFNRQPLVNRLRASGRNWFRTVAILVSLWRWKKQVRDFCIVFLQRCAELWNVVSHTCKWTEGN